MADIAKIRKNKSGLYIHLWWQGERHFISTYMGLVSFRDNEGLAWKAKAAIDSEIDRGVFRPERWKRRAKKLFNVRGYSKTWLDKIRPDISKATHHDYANSFKNHINPAIGHEYIEDINLDKLTSLMQSVNREPKGKKNVMGALHRMLDYAHRSGHIQQMPIFPEFRGTNEIIKPAIVWVKPNEGLSMTSAPIHVWNPYRMPPIRSQGLEKARHLRRSDFVCRDIRQGRGVERGQG